MLSHWNITLHANSYDIPSSHIILATGQAVLAMNYLLCDQKKFQKCQKSKEKHLSDEHLTREFQLLIWNLWLIDSTWNQAWDILDTERRCSTTRLPVAVLVQLQLYEDTLTSVTKDNQINSSKVILDQILLKNTKSWPDLYFDLPRKNSVSSSFKRYKYI